MKLIDILVEELPKRGGWPEGSTRCMQTDGLYITFPDIGDHCDFVAKCMAEGVRIATREQYETALADSKPKWDGEGLPPVGCECEYETRFDGWKPVRIELIKSEGIAFTWLDNSQSYNGLDCVGVQKSGSFRPIRPGADKKKDETIGALSEYTLADEARDIYDAIAAGKIPHIRID